MKQRPLGTTGLVVSAVGLGAGNLGDPLIPERDVERLLHAAVDLGITLIDAARSYGLAEERIGRALGGRRDRVVLSTKVGYGIPGFADWTGPCIAAGVDAALARFATDRIDVVHLHSCPREVLERGDVVEALLAAVAAGKVRVAAYSGENEALAWAAGCGAFGSLQASVNLCDQGALRGVLAGAAARGIGVLAKRPLANAPWRFAEEPAAGDVAEYWRRFRALALGDLGVSWPEAAVRFAAHAPGVASCLVGTARPAHLEEMVAMAARGPLPAAVLAAIEAAFTRHGGGWPGVI
jgi:aryl-alcohol dehydrogenase-like predicted oxidoreductase